MSLLIRVSFVKNHIYFVSCIVGIDGGHSSLGCVICQKSHLFFVMYLGDRRGSLLIRVCHLLKITFMFYYVLWGQTGVSLLKPYIVTSSNQPRLVWTGGGTNPFNKLRQRKYSTFSVNGIINLTCVCTLVYLHHTVVLAQTCDPGEAVT